jgi:CheY-like chemotaxis protein
MLTKLGCVVESAPDGRQGLGLLVGAAALPPADDRSDAHGAGEPFAPGAGAGPHAYDLVCLDNYMPVMTGEEAVRALRALGRDDLVVGASALADWSLWARRLMCARGRLHGDGAHGGSGELHRGGRGPRAGQTHNAQVCMRPAP